MYGRRKEVYKVKRYLVPVKRFMGWALMAVAQRVRITAEVK